MVSSISDSCATCAICRVWRTTCRMPHRRQKLRLFDAFLHAVVALEDRLKIGNESTHGGGRLLKGRTPSLSARARLLPVRCQLSVQVVDVFAFIKKKKTISVRFCGAYVSPEMDSCRNGNPETLTLSGKSLRAIAYLLKMFRFSHGITFSFRTFLVDIFEANIWIIVWILMD